jgi:hypothetical protein
MSVGDAEERKGDYKTLIYKIENFVKKIEYKELYPPSESTTLNLKTKLILN